jgi:hypothetical protein
MPRYRPEADEAQHRHHNDGFNPYYGQNFDHTQAPVAKTSEGSLTQSKVGADHFD